MALFSSPQDKNQNMTQTPNQNQYLSGDPSTDNNANTSWMSPSDSSGSNSSSGNAAQMQANPPSQVSNGTALGSIAAGNSLPQFGTQAPNADQLRQYAQGRGGQFTDSSLNYWSNPNKWNELVQRGQQLQPGSDGSWYANKFLSNAEEFTGGPHQTAMNMWGFDPAEQNNSGGGNNQLMMLLQSLLGGGGGQQMNSGAQPYNQYAGKNVPGQVGSSVVTGPNNTAGNTGITGGMNLGNIQPLPVDQQQSMIGVQQPQPGGFFDPNRNQRMIG